MEIKESTTMRIKTIILMISLIGFLAFQGCYDTFNCENGHGTIVTEVIEVPSFTGITFDVAGNVFLRQDSVQQVTVESYPNVISALNTSVRDDTWNIRFRECFNRYDRFNVYISVPDLSAVTLNGSGNIIGESAFDTDYFLISLPGSGNIELEMYAQTVDSEIPGSGNITLSGQTDSEIFFLGGSGNFKTFELISRTSQVTISGSGNCEVYASESLNVNISGSGSVRYKGNPGSVNSTITGSGTVSAAN